MNKWFLYLAAICIIIAVSAVIWNYYHTRKILNTIEEMLKSAMDGSFSEHSFDENRLSMLETKFAHYLSASEISARNVAIEKDKIKTLIADIAHQVKTPIANLLLYSELLEEQQLSSYTRSNVEALHRQAEKLNFLIHSLVKMSRLENGILSLSPRSDKLAPMLQKVWEQLNPKAESKGLFLRLLPTEDCAVYDAKWTNEALCNLVDNAIKYTESGGVTISVIKYEAFVCIEVADTGKGIPEEEQPKVFSRFYRSPAVAESEGVGIGLYLAREIIAGQGGYIKLTSAENKGSVFAVFLPR